MYYRGAAAAIVVYDITSLDTFDRAKLIVQKLKVDFQEGNIALALVGNKNDMANMRKVAMEVSV